MSATTRTQSEVCECGHQRWMHSVHVGKTVTQPCRELADEDESSVYFPEPCMCTDFKPSKVAGEAGE